MCCVSGLSCLLHITSQPLRQLQCCFQHLEAGEWDLREKPGSLNRYKVPSRLKMNLSKEIGTAITDLTRMYKRRNPSYQTTAWLIYSAATQRS